MIRFGSTFRNLSSFGIFNIGSLVYILLALGVLVLILLLLVILLYGKVNQQRKRLDSFTMGNDGKTLEQDIISIIEDNKFLKINTESNQRELKALSKRLEYAYQKVGLVKYDAFHQMGGQLSFSLCLLDERDNGFIINSVHSTEGCYVYTKEIKAGTSALDLGDEEAEALEIALGEKIN